MEREEKNDADDFQKPYSWLRNRERFCNHAGARAVRALLRARSLLAERDPHVQWPVRMRIFPVFCFSLLQSVDYGIFRWEKPPSAAELVRIVPDPYLTRPRYEPTFKTVATAVLDLQTESTDRKNNRSVAVFHKWYLPGARTKTQHVCRLRGE